MLTTLLLSQGVPMILGGDEFGRTQQGNNNAYCHDNELSWYDWEDADEEMIEYTAVLTQLRKDHPVFRRRRWFEGRTVQGSARDDIAWYKPDGEPMSDHDWRKGYAKSLAVYLNGKGIQTTDSEGKPVVDDSFIVLFNAHSEPIQFIMPDDLAGLDWEVVRYSGSQLPSLLPMRARETGLIESWSVAVLRKKNGVS